MSTHHTTHAHVTICIQLLFLAGLVQTAIAAGGTQVSSDDNGNMLDDGVRTYEWDHANRLRRVTRKSDGQVIAEYAYDALGRRVRKTVTSSGASDVTTDFGFDDGVIPNGESVVGNPYRFTARRLDGETAVENGSALYFYRNRHFSSDLGRFLERDPARDPANFENEFAYVGNNPVNRIDPHGLQESAPDAPETQLPPSELDTRGIYAIGFYFVEVWGLLPEDPDCAEREQLARLDGQTNYWQERLVDAQKTGDTNLANVYTSMIRSIEAPMLALRHYLGLPWIRTPATGQESEDAPPEPRGEFEAPTLESFEWNAYTTHFTAFGEEVMIVLPAGGVMNDELEGMGVIVGDPTLVQP